VRLFLGRIDHPELSFGADGHGHHDRATASSDPAQQHRQPTAVPVYSAQLAGSQAYFQVITDDANWELVVVSGTS